MGFVTHATMLSMEMPMTKRNRIVNEALCAQVRMNKCESCGAPPKSECHHIITRGRMGPDVLWNLMALCFTCHQFWHNKPTSEFFEKFPHMIKNLLDRGFIWENHFKKLFVDRTIHPEESWLN